MRWRWRSDTVKLQPINPLLGKWVSLPSVLSVIMTWADEIDFSLQVQCEYEASDLMRAANLRSLHAVTNLPPVVALGSFRVLMRIAQGNKTEVCLCLRATEEDLNHAFVVLDASFTSFYPEDQLPLTLPLREAAYVEVAIAQPSPDPTLSLRVRDCFAYPASRHSVWTLLYDGWVTATRGWGATPNQAAFLTRSHPLPPPAGVPTFWTT